MAFPFSYSKHGKQLPVCLDVQNALGFLAWTKSRVHRPIGIWTGEPHGFRTLVGHEGNGFGSPDDNWRRACALLATADVRVGGSRPWDMRVHHPATFDRILTQGSLGLGESYLEGWWDCERVDELITRILRARLDEQVGRAGWLWASLKARLTNLQ